MKLKEWGAFGLLGLIWGSSFLWIKVAVQEIGPFTLVAFRLLFALLGLLVIAARQKQPLPRERKALLGFLFMGVFNTALPFTLISWGETHIDSALASILNGTVPLFTIPAKPGEIGEIVITPLTQFAMPFIRYKNGDLGVLGSHRCPCGRGLPVLSEVVGRKHDILIRPDGQPVYGSVFGYITHNKPEIKQFPVYQPDRENLEVRLSYYRPVSSEWVSMLISELQPFFGPDMKIRVAILDNIPLTESGKLRFIISDIRHAELSHLH